MPPCRAQQGQGPLTAVRREESPDSPSHSACQVLGKASLVFEGLKSRSSPNVPWIAGATLKYSCGAVLALLCWKRLQGAHDVHGLSSRFPDTGCGAAKRFQGSVYTCTSGPTAWPSWEGFAACRAGPSQGSDVPTLDPGAVPHLVQPSLPQQTLCGVLSLSVSPWGLPSPPHLVTVLPLFSTGSRRMLVLQGGGSSANKPSQLPHS